MMLGALSEHLGTTFLAPFVLTTSARGVGCRFAAPPTDAIPFLPISCLCFAAIPLTERK